MNNLENYYNKKLQNREFEFKESYWEEAEQLIIADEKKRRKGLYFWLFGLLVFIIASGTLVWVGTQNVEKSDTDKAFLEESFPNQNLVVETPKQNPDQANQSTSNEQNDPAEFNIFNSNSNNQNSSTPDNSNDLTLNIKKDSTSKNYVQISGKEFDKPSKNNLSIAVPPGKIGVTSKAIMQNNQLEKVEMVPNEIDFVAIDKIALLSPITSLSTEIEQSGYPISKKISVPKEQRFNFGLTAAGLFANNEKAWIGASLGFVGDYKLSNQFSINTELLYTFRTATFTSDDFKLSSTTSQTDYGFGKKTVKYFNKPESLHFVDLPVYIEYHLSKHGIEGGISFSYLTGVRGKIEKETSLLPWERTSEDEFLIENYSSGWLGKEDFKVFYTSLMLGYKYHLNQNLALGLRCSYRFGELLEPSALAPLLIENNPVTFNVSASWYFLK